MNTGAYIKISAPFGLFFFQNSHQPSILAKSSTLDTLPLCGVGEVTEFRGAYCSIVKGGYSSRIKLKYTVTL
jgi:hypothetical protein